MHKVIIPSISILSLGLLIVILNSTTPVTAGPFGILTVFILAYLNFVIIAAYIIHFVSRLVNHLSISLISRKPFKRLDLKRSYYYSSVISAAPMMMIGLVLVWTVGFYELLLIVIFVAIGCLYISKRIS